MLAFPNGRESDGQDIKVQFTAIERSSERDKKTNKHFSYKVTADNTKTIVDYFFRLP